MSNPAEQQPGENSVDFAIRQAKEKAAQAPAQGADVTDLVPQNNQAPGAVQSYAPAKAPTLMDLTLGSMNVDGYLKVKEHGLLIDSKPNLVEKIKVSIDMNEVFPFVGVRFGNPVQYLKTYDNVNCASGGTWSAALAKAQLADPNCRPYTGADICMTLLEDAKDLKGVVVSETGVRLGHSTSITNKPAFGDFIKQVDAAGLMGQVVEAEITFKAMTNKNGQTWGILIFTLLSAPAAE